MRKHTVAVLLAAVIAPAMAGEAINKRIDADPDGEVVIEVIRGDVRVVGWDEAAVSVQGSRDDSSEEFHFERDGNVIIIEDEVRNGGGFGRSRGTNITVRIPRTSDLSVSVVAANLEISDLAAEVRAEAVSGSIDVEKVSGELRLETVSGDVRVDAASERMEVGSVSGRVRVVNSVPLLRGAVGSVSGSVGLETALGGNADLEVESISGEIELVLRGEINARISAETGPGGEIRNELSDEEPERTRYIGSESLDLRLGNGGADVDASVISGEIILRRD